MDKKKILKLVSQIIFFGAIWGITEATLGYLLHFLPPTIAGIVMFPIAAFILIKAYKSTGSKAALIYIGFIAAGIKAVDFLLPGMIVFKTINPMISIVLEAMVVAVAYPMLSNLKAGWKISGGIAASLGWRTGYIIYMVIQYFITGFVYLRVLGIVGQPNKIRPHLFDLFYVVVMKFVWHSGSISCMFFMPMCTSQKQSISI